MFITNIFVPLVLSSKIDGVSFIGFKLAKETGLWVCSFLVAIEIILLSECTKIETVVDIAKESLDICSQVLSESRWGLENEGTRLASRPITFLWTRPLLKYFFVVMCRVSDEAVLRREPFTTNHTIAAGLSAAEFLPGNSLSNNPWYPSVSTFVFIIFMISTRLDMIFDEFGSKLSY